MRNLENNVKFLMNNMNNKKNIIKQLKIKIKNFQNYLVMFKIKLMKLCQNVYQLIKLIFLKIQYLKVKNHQILINNQVQKRKKKIITIYHKLKIFLLILKIF